MNRVTVKQNIGDQLIGHSGPVEICDEQGRCLGHFLPLPVGADPSSVLTENDGMRSETLDSSLAEIWQSLESQ